MSRLSLYFVLGGEVFLEAVETLVMLLQTDSKDDALSKVIGANENLFRSVRPFGNWRQPRPRPRRSNS